MIVTPERAWMLDAARAYITGAPPPRPTPDLDMRAVIMQAYREKCAPLLIAAALATDAISEPALRRTVTNWRDRQRRKTKILALHTRLLVDRLAAAGIPSLVLKGAALAWGVHPDPAIRQFDDIDLLLPPDRLHEAARLLMDTGFTPIDPLPEGQLPDNEYHLQLLHPLWQIGIELHWRVGWRLFNTRHMPVTFEQIYRDSCPLRLAGGWVRTPGPTHSAILLSIDTVKEPHVPLSRFVDAALLIRRHSLTWGAVAPEARACGAEVEVEAVFAVVGLLLDPAARAAAPRDVHRVQAKLRHDLLSVDFLPIWSFLAMLSSVRQQPGERAAFWRGLWQDRALRDDTLLRALRDALRSVSYAMRIQRHPVGRRIHTWFRAQVAQARQRARAINDKTTPR